MSQLGPRKVDLTSAKDDLGRESLPGILTEKYENLSAEELKTISLKLEAEAEALANEGEYESASLKYTEAFELQYSLNRNHPLSLQYDASRVIRLQLEANNAMAETFSIGLTVLSAAIL